MSAAKNIESTEDPKKKEVLTYEEYIQLFPAWSEKTIERRMEDAGFPAKKIKGKLYMNHRLVREWWKKRTE